MDREAQTLETFSKVKTQLWLKELHIEPHKNISHR